MRQTQEIKNRIVDFKKRQVQDQKSKFAYTKQLLVRTKEFNVAHNPRKPKLNCLWGSSGLVNHAPEDVGRSEQEQLKKDIDALPANIKDPERNALHKLLVTDLTQSELGKASAGKSVGALLRKRKRIDHALEREESEALFEENKQSLLINNRESLAEPPPVTRAEIRETNATNCPKRLRYCWPTPATSANATELRGFYDPRGESKIVKPVFGDK
jgi:hypothetical protein